MPAEFRITIPDIGGFTDVRPLSVQFPLARSLNAAAATSNSLVIDHLREMTIMQRRDRFTPLLERYANRGDAIRGDHC